MTPVYDYHAKTELGEVVKYWAPIFGKKYKTIPQRHGIFRIFEYMQCLLSQMMRTTLK